MKVKHWHFAIISGPRENCAVRRQVDIIESVRTRLGFDPDEKPSQVLRSNATRGILNCTRQWGKIMVSAAKVRASLSIGPKSLSIVASPGERQSAEWVSRAADILRGLDILVRGDGRNPISLVRPQRRRLPSGSSAQHPPVGLPGSIK